MNRISIFRQLAFFLLLIGVSAFTACHVNAQSTEFVKYVSATISKAPAASGRTLGNTSISHSSSDFVVADRSLQNDDGFRHWVHHTTDAAHAVVALRIIDAEDVSRYGVHNVLMNAPEILQDLELRSGQLAWKPYAAIVDPFQSFVCFERSLCPQTPIDLKDFVCRAADITPDWLDGVCMMFFPHPNDKGTQPRYITVQGLGTTMSFYTLIINPATGFRCAR